MTVINMPLDFNEAEYIELAQDNDNGYFWKQLIPMDYELNYKGTNIKFDSTYLRNIKNAFEDNALGQQTAFQLANDDNEHDTVVDRATGRNYDPQRFRGEVEKLAINNRGLFGKFKLTKNGTQLIDDNKKLGVSVSLRTNYNSHNGRKYPVVMRHVLGTLDPKIRNMSDWQKEVISLTDDKDEEVIDLTTAETPEKTETNGGSDEENVTISKSELEQLRTDLKEYQDAEALIDEWSDEDEDDSDDDDDNEEGTDLSNEPKTDPRIIELSNKVAASEWKAERAELMRAGVPVKMLDLATPVMADGASSYDISLSNEETVDSKDLIRKILSEAKGTIDLSEERGHTISDDENAEAKKAYDSFESSFMNELF